jgi:succinyl-diaminopimelate desuccinylase
VLKNTALSICVCHLSKRGNMSEANLRALAQAHQADLVNFARRLVQTPSLPGHEDQLASLIAAEMRQLDFDEVTTDDVGNVVGWIRGSQGPTLMFNGHMDHVDPGPESGWPHPPYSGDVAADELWGRGSVDMKGPLAAMIYAAGLAKRYALPLPGDLVVAGVVMEETGGAGTQELTRYLKPDIAIVGEASAGKLMRGHRGRIELVVRVTGRAAHASVPNKGINPHYTLARFLTQIETLPMTPDEVFGSSSVAPTLYRTDQTSANVIPAEAQLTLDWRNVPGETPEQILERVNRLLAGCLLPGVEGAVSVATTHFVSYTGYVEDAPSIFSSFIVPADHPLLNAARRVLGETLGQLPEIDVWRFATDGGRLAAAGVTTIGFGPGDPALAHTNRERVPIGALVDGVAGYMALASRLNRANVGVFHF